MENQPNTVVVKSGGMGAAGAIALVLIAGGAAYGISRIVKQGKENAAEAEGGTPEGQIALQLKTVFEKYPVSDNDFRAAYLQVNASNKAKVFELYRKLTGRNLSDDIASHISSGTQTAATKVENYNSKPGKLFSITPSNTIQFEVNVGDYVRFMPGQTTPITMFNHPFGIIIKDLKDQNDKYSKAAYAAILAKVKTDAKLSAAAVMVTVKPSAKAWKVLATKTQDFSFLKESTAWYRAFINTKKQFALVQIYVGKDPKTNKPVTLWADARDLVSFKPTIKGIGSVSLIS